MRKGINIFTQPMNNSNTGMMRHLKSHFPTKKKSLVLCTMIKNDNQKIKLNEYQTEVD